MLVPREREPRVDDDDLAAVLEDGHVLADLAEAAERDDADAIHPLSVGAAAALDAGGLEQLEPLEAAADRLALVLGRVDERQPRPPTSCPSRLSAHLIAIGFADDLEQIVCRPRARGRSRAHPRRRPTRTRRTCSFTRGPTTCVCTQTPPTPPSSRNGWSDVVVARVEVEPELDDVPRLCRGRRSPA